MGFEVHDYEYIRNHMDEYQYTMALVKRDVENAIPNDIYASPEERERMTLYAFYMHLLRFGEMSVPKRCKECPFHSVTFNATGTVCDQCDINFATYVGDMFFAESRTRPKWCPI